MKTKTKRILALMLVFLLVVTTGGGVVSANVGEEQAEETYSDGLCEHHPEHTEDCGYQEASEGSDCTHEHTEDCYTQDENGETILDCQHEHDDTCGYEEATEGSPCTYNCEICSGNVLEEEETAVLEEETDEILQEEGTDEAAPTAGQTEISQWTWVDDYEIMQWSEENKQWEVAFPGASQSNPVTAEILKEMFPQKIQTEKDGNKQEISITWDFKGFPESAYEGEYTFTPSLETGYQLAKDAKPLKVHMTLGGADAYALSDYTVEGISPQGTTINLFDYWNGQNGTEVVGDTTNGINQNRQLHFHAGDAIGRDPFNTWTGSGGGSRQGIVKKTLENGYPMLGASNTLGIDQDESLAYLFNSYDSDTTGSNYVNGKKAYADVDGLLQLDDDGYYYYNAAYKVTRTGYQGNYTYNRDWSTLPDGFASANFATFNASTNSFELYNQGAVSPTGTTSPNGQFFPFDGAGEVFREANGSLQRKDKTSGSGSGLNHYFGLSMTSRFVQQEGGTNDGKDVTYQFSGDDDVWVFIDDVLVGDLGGIHDACSFTINFKTGNVTVYNSVGGEVQNTTLRNLYNAAGRLDSVQWSADNRNTFADNTYHTLNFFYLERGNNDSNMSLKFNLVTVPQSSVFKVDQAGEPVAGAEFELYSADENYNVGNLICRGTTNEAGEFVFVDDEGFLISLEDLYNTYDYLVLKETKAPEGYRKIKDAELYFYEGNGNLALLSGNHWETGAYASGNATISSGEKVELEDGTEVNLDDGGTMFAVVLRYKGPTSAETADLADSANWTAMYGDPIDGWHSYDTGDALGDSIQAAQTNMQTYNKNYSFAADSSGAYVATVTDLPGDVKTYYHMLDNNEKENTKYIITFYYTTASSVMGATTGNTSRVADTSNQDLFKRNFSVNLFVTDIKNNLYVQKLDNEGHAVSVAEHGSATFALVPADNNGDYDETIGAWDEKDTADLTEPFALEGGIQFTGIPEGKYYLVETQAPDGYKLNSTPIAVVVDNTGVYVDAGNEEDGVAVWRGVGSIVKSMVQFAADDMVDATLHDIQAILCNTDNYEGEGTTWTETGQQTHLQYLTGNPLLEYGPATTDSMQSLQTTSGWSKLVIQQCLNHDDETNSPKQEIGDIDLVNLFSGSVIVNVEDQKIGNLQISKTVTGDDAPAGAVFAFDITLRDAEGDLLNGEYTTVDESNQTGTITFTDGKPSVEVKLMNGESITIQDLPAGATYTIQETDIPAGFTPSVTVTGDATAQTQGGTVNGTVPHNQTAAAAYTNDYNGYATVTISGRKTLDGRNLTQEDHFGFTVEAAGDTVDAVGAGNVVMPQNTAAEVTGDGSVNTMQYSFDGITFKQAGTYTFHVKETLPQGVTGDSPSQNGMTYDTHTAVVTVTVEANADGILEAKTVSYDNTGAIDAQDAQTTDMAAFTNYVSADFAFTKITKDGAPLGGAVFALYRLECTDTEHHDHADDLIEVGDAQTGVLSDNYAYKDCWKLVDVQTSSEDEGEVNFTGIAVSGIAYRLVEIKAPDGYTLPNGQWIVSYNEDEKEFTIQENGAVGNPPAFNGADGTIINYLPSELPFAGNIGILKFLAIGAVLMAAGGAGFLWNIRRKRRMQRIRKN
ncbi:hypothetical protein B5F53_16425 [Blautia sp. An249]|uniref:SpaA isopeptide-forming pilin-related protein n=1 Tax=Blautia sp. An249 TaxID=1965603 RepID=UPI000B3A0993|nr:SpaA isopeptide-forming pilin-related protein [Blautia sp. An249]OUO76688.1 hypothetical protein B5F53_16425 [Blautia sp. An249]